MCSKHDMSISSRTKFPLASHPAMASMAASEPERVQTVIHTRVAGASLRVDKAVVYYYIVHCPFPMKTFPLHLNN